MRIGWTRITYQTGSLHDLKYIWIQAKCPPLSTTCFRKAHTWNVWMNKHFHELCRLHFTSRILRIGLANFLRWFTSRCERVADKGKRACIPYYYLFAKSLLMWDTTYSRRQHGIITTCYRKESGFPAVHISYSS